MARAVVVRANCIGTTPPVWPTVRNSTAVRRDEEGARHQAALFL